MSYQLPESSQKAGYVRRKFDEISARYDLFNDLITQGQHRLWKKVLIDRVGQGCSHNPAVRGLDLCCGTGDIAQKTIAKLKDEGGLFAMDFSANMLKLARNRLSNTSGAKGAARMIICGDAMHLPFAPDSLGFVTVGYGLRNVSDLEQCLAEIYRVIAPGGILGTLDVGKVENRLLRPLVNFYMFKIVPMVGKLLQPGQEMFSYLPHSTQQYPGQHLLKEMMIERGFQNVEIIEFLFGASVIHLARKPN